VLARELAEKAEQAEHARAEEERRAIAAERSRIARELHDVLAHSLSVMVVQSGAARRIVERDPERAAQAAELVRETGREALAELRHLFGPVRRGEGEELSGPPSIVRVEQLAARTRAAGLDVRVEVEGTPVELPPGVDLTAYRVVQEALTNTLKHAGSANAIVTVGYGANELAISVEDDGTPGEGALDESGGHGLLGMRERVALYGGAIEAGPRPGGGFAVSARLPIRPLVPA
jgi:signal transduction histidine kinase